MKGRISSEVGTILNDPRARRELRALLIEGRDGVIHLAGRVYRINVTGRSSKMSGPTKGNGMRAPQPA